MCPLNLSKQWKGVGYSELSINSTGTFNVSGPKYPMVLKFFCSTFIYSHENVTVVLLFAVVLLLQNFTTNPVKVRDSFQSHPDAFKHARGRQVQTEKSHF